MNENKIRSVCHQFKLHEKVGETWLLNHGGLTQEEIDEMVSRGILIVCREKGDFMQDKQYQFIGRYYEA